MSTLRTLSARLRRWHHKQQTRHRVAKAQRTRARRRDERELEVLRHDAKVLLAIAETAVSELPKFRQMKLRPKLEKLRERIEK